MTFARFFKIKLLKSIAVWEEIKLSKSFRDTNLTDANYSGAILPCPINNAPTLPKVFFLLIVQQSPQDVP